MKNREVRVSGDGGGVAVANITMSMNPDDRIARFAVE